MRLQLDDVWTIVANVSVISFGVRNISSDEMKFIRKIKKNFLYFGPKIKSFGN